MKGIKNIYLMSERLRIRLSPKDGESLSSYLIRSAAANGTCIKKIIRYCNLTKEYKHITARKIAHIDILPRSFINMNLLSELLGIDRIKLESMTFTPLIDKLVLNEKESDYSYFKMLSKVVLSTKKRICPECIKNDKSFKLVWQIEEIEICIEHLSELQSICPICKRQIPYYFNEMHTFECPSCKAALTE